MAERADFRLRRPAPCATPKLMEILAHGLWTAAGAITASRATTARIRTKWAVWWGVFPDVLAFGPSVVAGLVLLVVRGREVISPGAPHVHLGVPLYPAGHSLLVFALAFAAASIVARRVVWEMLGWLLHILIDIPTHSYSYYATRFLWPVSDVRVNGVPWWTPWFWAATYVVLAVVYVALWRKGWLKRSEAEGVGVGIPVGIRNAGRRRTRPI